MPLGINPLDYQPQDYNPQQLMQQGQVFSPSNVMSQQEFENLIKAVLDDSEFLDFVEHKLRSEVCHITENGKEWRKDPKREPVIKSEQAINEILQIIEFEGLNKIARITQLDDEQIRVKLRTFEHKLADLLFLNRKEWGIEKNKLPMLYDMIRNIVEDARYVSLNGNLLKVLRTTYSRNEYEDTTTKNQGGMLQGMSKPLWR